MKPITIIIPTWNNEQYLNPCVMSIVRTGVLDSLADLIIVNNGKQDIERTFGHLPQIKILNPGTNLGWEGGLQLGMQNSTTPFAVFQNDDTFLPPSSAAFYQRLLVRFQNENIAAVGPTTTCAAGIQSVYHPSCPLTTVEVAYLIFFTVMVRRAHYDDVGGIDTAAPGGDDFDLSMRLRQAGHHLVVDPGAFIIHHGFKTGERVKGDASTKGGWNSIEMSDRTNKYLITKHGFKPWWKTMRGLTYDAGSSLPDLEGDLIREWIGTCQKPDDQILELGCGSLKTVQRAIGVDRVPKGDVIPHLNGKLSVADVVAEVDKPIPLEDSSADAIIARHILEHCIDAIDTINNWKRLLKIGGHIFVAVPDERVTSSIPLNPEHVHAFSPESLRNLMGVCGLKEVKSSSAKNGVSFVGLYERMN